jgi:proteasome lid subunit RPN8/RPN11
MSKKATDKKSAVPNLNQDKDQAPNSAKGKGNSKKTAPTTETKETKKKSAIDKLDLAKVDDIDRTEIEVEKKIDPTSPCVLSTKAYRRMVIYGLRYANFDIKPKNWREVYGILVGKVDKKGVCHILDAIPMVVGDRAGVIFETKQYVDMAQIDQSIFERAVNDQTGQFICGWWHTHPGFGFFFSEVDTITQLGYQIPNPFALGIVFDHTEKTENFPGVEALRLDDPTKGVLAEYITSELEFDKSFDEVKKEADRSAEKILPKFKEVKEKNGSASEKLRSNFSS